MADDPVNSDDGVEETPAAESVADPSAAPPAESDDDAAAAALKAAMAVVSGLRDETSEATTTAPSADPEPTTNPPPTADAAVEPTAPTPTAAGEEITLPEFSPTEATGEESGVDLLSRVNLNVRIELGRTKMLVEDVLRLNEGSVVELDKLAGDPVDIYVNDRLVACGEVLVLNDSFSVRINEIVGHRSPLHQAPPSVK